MVNNTIGTAQGVLFTDFTPNIDPNVFGNLPTATITGANGRTDIDFFSFQTGVGTGYFDIDNDPFTFDSILSLFDSTGTLLAYGDDSDPVDPGSAVNLDVNGSVDAFLGTYTFTQAGTYYIVVTDFNGDGVSTNFPNAAFVDPAGVLTRPDGEFGGFTVNGTPGDASFPLSGPQAGSPYTLNVSLSNPTGASVNPVPEPSEWLAMGMASVSVGGLIIRARRRRS